MLSTADAHGRQLPSALGRQFCWQAVTAMAAAFDGGSLRPAAAR